MEGILITQESQDDSVSSVDDNQSETVEKKQTELLEQKRLEEEAKRLAGNVPIKFELHHRGLIRS